MSEQEDFKSAYRDLNRKYVQGVALQRHYRETAKRAIDGAMELASQYEKLITSFLLNVENVIRLEPMDCGTTKKLLHNIHAVAPVRVNVESITRRAHQLKQSLTTELENVKSDSH